MEAEFLYNPHGGLAHCHAATLSPTPGGDLMAAWYAYPEDEHRGGILCMARRRAGETEWSKSRDLLGPFEYSVGNPVLFTVPDGNLWLLFVQIKGAYWNDAELFGARSEDDGHTWSAPLALRPEPGLMVRHRPIALENGRLLLPAYDEREHKTVLLSSRAPFDAWEPVYRFEDPPLIQADIVRTAPGHLVLFFRPKSDMKRIWRSRSADDGTTWSIPVRTALPNPLSGIAALNAGEGLALVYNHTEEHRRYPLSINLSRDEGVTWGSPWHLDEVRHEVSYPSFFLDAEGRVQGVYTYNRRMIKYVSFEAREIGANT